MSLLATSALFLIHIHFGKSLWFTWIRCNEASACRVSIIEKNNNNVNQLFSFSSDKDRRTDSRIRRKKTAQPRRESNPGSGLANSSLTFARPWVRFPVELRCVFSSDPAVSSSIFVGVERKELIRNDPDKSEFTNNNVVLAIQGHFADKQQSPPPPPLPVGLGLKIGLQFSRKSRKSILDNCNFALFCSTPWSTLP